VVVRVMREMMSKMRETDRLTHNATPRTVHSDPAARFRILERRLNPFTWTIVAFLTAAAFTVAFGAVAPVGPSSPLLLGLPFLAVIAVAMLTFMMIDQRLRRRSLSEALNTRSGKITRLGGKLESLRTRLYQKRQESAS
jgi:hypothetical protein